MTYDVAIVGAGAAGLAAGRRLTEAGVRAILLEARDRVGGRGHTIAAPGGLPLDMGCGWLHSGDRNPMTGVAQAQGLTVDRTPAAWGQAAPGFGMTQVERAAFGRAMERMDETVRRAAEKPADCAVSTLLDSSDPSWPLLNAFSAYYNGAEFDQVSAKDYAAFEDDEVNWRVAEGYGRAIAGLGAGVEISLETPVSVVEHGGAALRLVTPRGPVEAAFVIVTVPTDILAAEAIRFDPGLPDWIEAASRLPLGLADKVYLALDEPEAFPRESHMFGRHDRAGTGSYYLRPLGRPVIEVYLGGSHARGLEAQGEGATSAFAMEELAALLGSDIRRTVRPIAASRWASDPWSRGSYSHALPGYGQARSRLAEPVDGRLFFAGEATSAHSFSTAHGAYLEGMRAAEAVLERLRPSEK